MESTAGIFAANRSRLAASLPPDTLAVTGTGPWPLACGQDSAEPWPDFWHLTGCREPQSALILTTSAGHPPRCILFTPPSDARRALWDGPASAAPGGITEIRPWTEFEQVLRALAFDVRTVFVHAPENPFAPQDDGWLAGICRRVLPLHPIERLAPLTGRLRAGKRPEEIESIRAANTLAASAFRRAMGFVRPGVRGFEVRAEFLHEIMRHGSAGFCCPALTAAGAETLTLHWTGARRPWQAGELALLDFTVEWNGLCADVARCVPVGGRFSARQRQIYEAVQRVLVLATAALKPGRLLGECQREVELALQHELLRMGLLKAAEVREPSQPSLALRGYFMHQAYHHIGLEVHDPVPADMPLAPGQVIAVEPAIYCAADGFGIRLEDNILITASGPENLSAGLPVDAAEIEDLLQL